MGVRSLGKKVNSESLCALGNLAEKKREREREREREKAQAGKSGRQREREKQDPGS